jgi:choline-sulfatase
MASIRRWACVLWLASSAFAGTVAPPTKTTLPGPATPPNIILITLDTVRADRMGFLGSKRGLTPNLDALARHSTVFTSAYSQVPLTAPSHAAILTGTYPQFNLVDDFQVPLSPDLPYAPAILRDHGYKTAAFVGAIILDPKAKFAPGFDRGFDTYDAGFTAWHSGEDRYKTTERRGGEVVARALEWLKENPKGPFFIWVHLYDAHHPYEPPEPFKTKYIKSPYDGEIAYVDSSVGKFLTQLRARGFYNNSLIAVMADHGEALGDHGEDTHGIFLYDETIHVPLVIKLPGANSTASASGKRNDSRVELVDVLPTILEAAQIAVPKEVQGESLLELMTSKEPAGSPAASATVADKTTDRPAYAETDYPHRAYGWSSLRALRTGKYLYIDAPRRELYDQATDPQALHNLATGSTAVAGTLAGQLDAFRAKTKASSGQEAPAVAADPEAQQKLSALGYVASGSNLPKPGSKELGADPKDEIETSNISNRVTFLMESNGFQEAIPLLEKLIAKQPDATLSYIQLGRCLIFTKDFPRAVTELRKIVTVHPDLTVSHFQLGMALLATGDAGPAVTELEIAVSRIPRWERAHLLLANAYLEMDRVPDAIQQCQKVLEFDPNHYATNILLGRVLVVSGKPEAAITNLNRAAAVQPQSPEPHVLLTKAYDKLGRTADAERERAEASRLGAGDEQ